MQKKLTTSRSGNAAVQELVPKMVVAEPQGSVGDSDHTEVVRGFIFKLIGDPALADDLTQETLLRAYASESKFKGKAAKTTWLCAIALHVMRDHYRATARRPALVSDPQTLAGLGSGEVVEDNLLRDEMDSCIRQYLLRLPERQRDVVALHDVAGLTHREISSVLEISEGNSRILLHRGRAALKLLLAENCTLCFDRSVPCEPKTE
jgi:RNA polymerase sigma-70 factor (ECF subfamily)